MLHCCEDAVTKLEYSCRVVILPVAVMAECNSQGFVDERAIIVHLQWGLWSQRTRSRITRYLQISRWQFGGESSAILKFMAVRVEARRDGLFFFFFFLAMTQQNATLTGQERQRDFQLKVC